MSNPPKPWKAEYAKSSRSSCKTCKKPIEKEILRLGKMVQATQFDGFMPMWNHADCILRKANQIKAGDDVEGLELLRWEDQQKIRKYIEGGGPTKASPPPVSECGIETSQTSRATCRRCNEKIMKGEARVSVKPDGQNPKSLAWYHAKCFTEMSPTVEVNKLAGWASLPAADQATVLALVKPASLTAKGKKVDPIDEPLQGSGSNTAAKRKRALADNGKSKVAKSKDDPCPDQAVSGTKSTDLMDEHAKATDLESQLEAQSRVLWALKDDLKKHVSTVELRQMLEINCQDSTGSELDLRERCADGMLFGALATCPLCKGFLRYSSGMYKCHGYLSEWSKCSYSTTEPERVKGKWQIPEGTENEYLLKWFKSQKLKRPSRILPQPTFTALTRCQSSNTMQKGPKSEDLRDLKISIAGSSKDSMDGWKKRLEAVGAQVHKKINKDTNCLVVIDGLDDQDAEIRKARRMKLPIVRMDYLEDCVNKGKKLPFDFYKIEAVEDRQSIVTIKVKGRSAVHEASGLQDSGHILEDGKSLYNTTLSMSDLSTGVNSYYILQIIQEDKGSDCYVFRKWGRVGNEKIGGVKLDEMTKSNAINEFKRLFLEKTGNSWEAWEQKHFQKQPGRFYPLDIDYGINRDVSRKKSLTDSNSLLATPLVELMNMLFNVETYRAAMMEFEINMSEMPLGKLSKSNIQKGFEALTEIQNLLGGNANDPAMTESLIIDASNRFFTLIPSIHPHVIRDKDDFWAKVKMLEALQDIEIASRLVGFDVDDDDSLDDKYKKLGCEISPIPHDSEDYRLVEKYLQTTHAPTHTEWSLELEEVFALERAGEYDQYLPYRQKLGNRMLLWHGSRLTNFVGILSQGLRIAPPEAPATGYMFGKGIYFADLVSKSAQYCYADRKNPVGLILLSEVALGEVYELKKAKYMDKPPKGKHSTKGLGKKVPKESDFVRWKDDVVVPCGKPVSSSVTASELMYNEYIVYSTSQVKLQFLLKVRFHHKR